jgi:protein-tyrosine phosphatase
MKILVVCAGNTCRSPAAEAAIRRAADRAALDVEVFSAGTSAERVGEPPTEAMVRAGKARGLEISGSSTQVTPADVESAHLILALDHATELFLSTLSPRAAPIELLGSYDASGPAAQIPDPFDESDDVYAETLDRIISASEALVAQLSG